MAGVFPDSPRILTQKGVVCSAKRISLFLHEKRRLGHIFAMFWILLGLVEGRLVDGVCPGPSPGSCGVTAQQGNSVSHPAPVL